MIKQQLSTLPGKVAAGVLGSLLTVGMLGLAGAGPLQLTSNDTPVVDSTSTTTELTTTTTEAPTTTTTEAPTTTTTQGRAVTAPAAPATDPNSAACSGDHQVQDEQQGDHEDPACDGEHDQSEVDDHNDTADAKDASAGDGAKADSGAKHGHSSGENGQGGD